MFSGRSGGGDSAALARYTAKRRCDVGRQERGIELRSFVQIIDEVLGIDLGVKHVKYIEL